MARFFKTLIFALIVFSALASRAQTYTLDRSVISGGGGIISGGQFTLDGTLGQIDAGTLTGGIYELDGGFWSLNVAVQNGPLISIIQSGANVTISWAANVTGFRLEVSPTLGPSANWQTVSGVVNNSVSQPLVIGARFFRLKSP